MSNEEYFTMGKYFIGKSSMTLCNKDTVFYLAVKKYMGRNYWDCKKYMITLQGLGCINFTKTTAASATHYFHETTVHLYLFT